MDYSMPSINFSSGSSNNNNNPPSLNFDFSSFDNPPSSPSPSYDQSTPQNNPISLVPVDNTPNFTSNMNNNNIGEDTLSSVQQRMEQMKLNQQNLKRLQEERKKEEQNNLSLSNMNSNTNLNQNQREEPKTPQIPSELINSMTKFMGTVDTKLQNMENQLRKLTLDFHQACSKQEQNTQVLSQRLKTLKGELEDTRSVVVNSSPVSTSPPSSSYPSLSSSAMSSPFTPPSYNSNSNSNSNSNTTAADEALAKKLQEEFDREQNSRPQTVSNQPQTFTQNQSSNFVQSPSYPPQSEVKKENCPVCGLLLTVGKELTEHAASHFDEPQQQRSSYPTNNQMVTQNNTQQHYPQQTSGGNANNNNSNNNGEQLGFFARVFGAKPKPQTQPGTTYYSQPPTTSTQPRPQYYPAQSPNSQGGTYPQQVVYLGPNGQPLYPQPQPR